MKASVLTGLLVLTLAALALRLTNLGFGLPQAHEPDLRYVVNLEWLRGGIDFDESTELKQWYPLLVPRLTALAPAGEEAPAGAPLAQHLAAAAEPVVQLRATVASLAALVVPLTFLLARRFLSGGWSLMAAALAGSSLLHLVFSQQARPHGATATTFALAVLGAMALRRRGDLVGWLLASAGAALALGTLHSGVAVLLSLATAWVLRARSDRRWLTPGLLVALVVLVAAALYFYPFSAIAPAPEDRARSSTLDLSGHVVYLSHFQGRGAKTVLRTLLVYDPVLLATAALGALATFSRLAPGRRKRDVVQRDELWIALAFALPYTVVICLYSGTFERFVIPLVPFLAVLGAFGLSHGASALGRRMARLGERGVGTVSTLVVLALPVFACARLVRVRGAPHTTELAGRWVAENVEPGTTRIVLTPGLDLPLARRAEGLTFRGHSTREEPYLIWARYQAIVGVEAIDAPRYDLAWPLTGESGELPRLAEDPVGRMRAMGASLAVIEVFAPNRAPFLGAQLRRGLQEGARLVASFTPDRTDDYGLHPFECQEATVKPPAPPFVQRLMQARGTGPLIEIYDLGLAPTDAGAETTPR